VIVVFAAALLLYVSESVVDRFNNYLTYCNYGQPQCITLSTYTLYRWPNCISRLAIISLLTADFQVHRINWSPQFSSPFIPKVNLSGISVTVFLWAGHPAYYQQTFLKNTASSIKCNIQKIEREKHVHTNTMKIHTNLIFTKNKYRAMT